MNLDSRTEMGPFAALRVTSVLRALLIGVLALAPVFPAAALHAQSLEKRLNRRLDTRPFDKSLWGVAVVDHKGKLLYGRNERRLFTPASNAKLVVTAVASALLPPGLTVQHQPLRRGAGRRRRAAGRPGALRPRRPHLQPTVLRHRHAGARVPATGTRSPGSARWPTPSRRGVSGRSTAISWATAAGSRRRRCIRDGSCSISTGGTPRRSPGSRFNDNSLDFALAAGHPRSGAPALISMSPDLGDVVVREPDGHGAGRRRDRHRRPLLPRSPGTAQVWAEGHCRARPAAAHRVVRDERPEPLRRPGAPAGAGRRGDRRHRDHPLDHRLGTLRGRRAPGAPLAETIVAPGARLDLPDPQHAARTSSPRCCSSSWASASGAPAPGSEGYPVERRFLIDSVRIDSTEFDLLGRLRARPAAT